MDHRSIDGTFELHSSTEEFCDFSWEFYVDDIGKIGMVYDIFSDELYHAIKGQGAFLNDQELPSLEEASVSKAIISINASWVTENREDRPESFGTT